MAKKSVTTNKHAQKKRTPTNKNKRILKVRSKPDMPWQVDEYKRDATFNFILPYQFLLLCRLMEVTPDQILTDFMDNLSCGSWKRKEKDLAKQNLIQYFLTHGYGQHHYTVAEIEKIFKELDAIGLLFPHDSNDKMLDIHVTWRDNYYHYWFNKWFRKPRKL